MDKQLELDLGLEDLTECGESYLLKDSPLSESFTESGGDPSHHEINEQQAIEAGKLLDDERCISLIFLLLPNSAKALSLCRKIESGRIFPTHTNGEALMLNLAKYTKGELSSLGWAGKILCALHLLCQYLAIIKIDKSFGPGGFGKAKRKFEGIEWHYLDPKRISMLKICQSLRTQETRALMSRLSFMPTEEDKKGFKALETVLLLGLLQRNSQEELLKELDEKLSSRMANNDLYIRTLRPQRAIEKSVQLRKGMCLIISQKNYNPNSTVDSRDGADHDEESLAKTFRRFGCQITIKTDLSDQGLLAAMREFREDVKAHSADITYVAVCISSHGKLNEKTDKEEIIGINGIGVPTDELTGMLTDGKKCAELIGKPKLFFIQACRGGVDNDYQQIMSVSQFAPELQADSHVLASGDQVPIHSWFMIVHSTLPGHTAWRNSKTGSLFIQSFCHAMKHYGNSEHLEGIIGMTIASMETARIRQVPIKYSCLYKDLYFTDYEI